MQAFSTTRNIKRVHRGYIHEIGKPYAVQIFLPILFQGISNSFVF